MDCNVYLVSFLEQQFFFFFFCLALLFVHLCIFASSSFVAMFIEGLICVGVYVDALVVTTYAVIMCGVYLPSSHTLCCQWAVVPVLSVGCGPCVVTVHKYLKFNILSMLC